MKIRIGEYTSLEGYDFKLYEARQDAPIPFTHFILGWEEESSCPVGGFEKNKHGSIIKIIERNLVQNAFQIVTLCLYKGEKIKVWAYNPANNCFTICTKDEIVADKLNFIKLSDMFIKEVQPNEIEKLWEVRLLSKYNLPMPDGLENVKEIDFK
jgi:hypothetical protein